MAATIRKMRTILVLARPDVKGAAIVRLAGHRLIFFAFAQREARALVKFRGLGIKDA